MQENNGFKEELAKCKEMRDERLHQADNRMDEAQRELKCLTIENKLIKKENAHIQVENATLMEDARKLGKKYPKEDTEALKKLEEAVRITVQTKRLKNNQQPGEPTMMDKKAYQKAKIMIEVKNNHFLLRDFAAIVEHAIKDRDCPVFIKVECRDDFCDGILIPKCSFTSIHTVKNELHELELSVACVQASSRAGYWFVKFMDVPQVLEHQL